MLVVVITEVIIISRGERGSIGVLSIILEFESESLFKNLSILPTRYVIISKSLKFLGLCFLMSNRVTWVLTLISYHEYYCKCI